MNRDQMTRNSQQALQQARELALQQGHAEIDNEHLLLALLDQADGLVPRLLEKMALPVARIRQQLQALLDKRSQVSGTGQQLYLSPRLDRMLSKAQHEAESLKDDYISVEHLLLALLGEDKNSELG